MKSYLSRAQAWYLTLCLFLFAPFMAQAQPPSYAGTTFDKVQEVTDDATLYFGVIVVLAVLVTGFFLGRRWLSRVG